MAFSLPDDLPTDWADNVGMIENAAFLNDVGAMGNALKSALNAMVNGAATAYVATSETTASTSYTDLTTTTDTVTATVGDSGMVLVLLKAQFQNSGANYCYCSVALSGANTVAASDNYTLLAAPNAVAVQMGIPIFLTGLTAGSTTFKMKYKVAAGTGTWLHRRITVIPMP